MQNRYAGDVGDYVKLALLRALAPGFQVGVAWYLYPDEGHNADGKHVAYLRDVQTWRALDPELFDSLRRIVATGRSVAAIEAAQLLNAVYASESLGTDSKPAPIRSTVRAEWFNRVLQRLTNCDLVFADPDNGLTDDNPQRRRRARFAKQMPLTEARAIAAGRTAIIYHHNTRRSGGHGREIDYWRELLGGDTIAVRANAYSCRTFFIVNPTEAIVERAQKFCAQWSRHKVSFVPAGNSP